MTSFGEQKRWNIEQMEEFYGVYERARLGPRTGNKTKQVLKKHGIFFSLKIPQEERFRAERDVSRDGGVFKTRTGNPTLRFFLMK